MKKFLVLVVLASGLDAAVFSFSPSESSTGLGFGWGNFFEGASKGGDSATAHMSAPGITSNAYGFWNKGNVGIFSNIAFLLPNEGTLNINGTETTVDLSAYDVLFLFNASIGPGFRLPVNEKLTVRFGVGLNYMQTTGSYSRFIQGAGNVGFALLGFNFGIGGDVGAKFDITDVFFISIGSTFSYDFASHVSLNSSFGNTSGWASNYSMFGFRPYLCVGLNSYVTEPGFAKGKLGKPQ